MGGEGGTVEADETFIGGLSRTGTGGAGKVAVFGLLERNGEGKSKVRATVVPDRFKSTIQPIIKENVEAVPLFIPMNMLPTRIFRTKISFTPS